MLSLLELEMRKFQTEKGCLDKVQQVDLPDWDRKSVIGDKGG